MWLWWMLACVPGQPSVTEETGADTADTVPAGTVPADIDAARLDALLAGFVADEDLPGASACVIGGGEALWCGAAGDADIAAGRAATPDTPYLLASLSKAVIGLAVTRLVMDGQITLDDPVEPIVGFSLGASRDRGAAITWRTLVTHTSGVRDDWDVMDRFYVDGDSPVALGAFLEAYLAPGGDAYRAGHFADHAPGARAVYSNIGASLAAYAVERVVAQPFDDWCDAQVFAPLGLRDTHWHLGDFAPETVAVPYSRRRGGLVAEAHYGVPDYPDGQLRASARDVATILAEVSIDGGRVLPTGGVERMLTPPLPAIDPVQGVFWYAERRRGVEVWGHNGGEVGASTDGFYDPLTSAGFVMLVNTEPPAAPMLAVEAEMLAIAIDAIR